MKKQQPPVDGLCEECGFNYDTGDLQGTVTLLIKQAEQTGKSVNSITTPDGTTLITEQQVMFSTAAAAVALRPAKVSRWSIAIKSVSGAMSALFTDSRPPAQRYVARRYVYLEVASMSREMYRL